MLEIDGEFFEDPCETIRVTRAIVAAALLATAFTSYGEILSQPLFPSFAEGGISNPNTLKGDIVHVK